MKQTFQTKAAQFLKETEKRKRWRRVVVSLALVVAMLTGNLLMLPAVTMETETECGLTAHAHTEECYTTELTCPLPVSDVYVPAHTHTDECKGEQESVLTCTVEPYAAHTHDETCYGVACGQEEWEAHTHGDGCYEAEEYLACDIPLGHKHTDACYEHVDERICGQEEGDGAHTHGDGCYTEGELSCGTAESAGHVHGDGCWQSIKTDTLSCTLAETEVHEHSKESCYATREKLVCTKREGEGHAHDESCIGLVCELTAGPGHVHEDGCYGLQDTYICGQEETQEIQIHAHDESCYAQVLDCALPEHEHTAECYGTLYCGAGEHVHGDECYAAPLTCEDDSEEHVHGDACYGEAELVCGIEEHEHSDECYVEPPMMILLPEGAEIPEGYDVEYQAADPDDRFAVAVYAPVGALPEGAVLMANLQDENSDEYAAAQEALDAEYDGMVALDIRFELEGGEVEPTEPVYVYINVIGLLPGDADPETIVVHHIKETEQKILDLITVNTEVSAEVVADCSEETGVVKTTQSEEIAALNMEAAFEVDSFSVFAATYKKENLNGGIYNRAEEELYLYAMKQNWGSDSAMNGELVTLLDYAEAYPDVGPLAIDIHVNEALPSEYGSNGLVLGLEKAESVEIYYANDAVKTFMEEGRETLAKNSDALSSIQELNGFGCSDAMFVVGRDKELLEKKGYSGAGEWVDGQIQDTASSYKGQFGAIYRKIGYYNGHQIDLRLTVVDYAVHENDYHRYYNRSPEVNGGQGIEYDAAIGLFMEGKKPGVAVTNIAWVELNYEFFDAETGEPIVVKGNTTYWDIDEYQAVHLDESCKGVYITKGPYGIEEDGRLFYGSPSERDNHKNKRTTCRLGLGWFDKDSAFYRDGYTIYEVEGTSYASDTKVTACAFTEAFEGSSMKRVFSFMNTDEATIGYYGPYGGENGRLPYTAPNGNIYNSGLPVNREGSLYIKKNVTADNGGTVDTTREFDFTMTLNDTSINGSYGLNFTNGVATFKLKHNQGVQVINLPAGTDYTITETATEEYIESVVADNAGETTGTGNIISGVIRSSVEYDEAQAVPTITFVNKANTGDLVIDKKVKSFGEEKTGDTFTFTLTNAALAGKSFNGGAVVFDNSGTATVTVTAGTPFTVSGLPAGAAIQVIETCYDGYAPSWSLDGSSYTNGNAASEVTIPAGGSTAVYFINTTGPELPSTGGMGTQVYVTVGTTLMLGAGLILAEQERRRRRSYAK